MAEAKRSEGSVPRRDVETMEEEEAAKRQKVEKAQDEAAQMSEDEDEEKSMLEEAAAKAAAEAEAEARAAEALAKKQEGNVKYKGGDYFGAIDCYSEAINMCPETAMYYLNRASANMMVARSHHAVADCDAALKIEPNNLKAWLRKGKAHLKLGQAAEAINAYQMGLRMDPTNSTGLGEKTEARKLEQREKRANECYKEGNFSMATSLVNAALRSSPESFSLQLLKLMLLVEHRDYSTAYNLSNKLVREQPRNMDLLYARSKVLFHQENFPQAIRHLLQVLQSDPDNSKAAKDIKLIRKLERTKAAGNAAFKAGQFQEAHDKYAACINLNSGLDAFCAKLHCNKAATLLKLGKPQEALSDCDQAIKLDGSYGKAYMRRAATLRRLGGKENLERALFDYKEAENILGRSRDIQQAIRETKVEVKKAKRKDYYKILGLENKREDASEGDIKKAYRKSALKWHPDRHATGDDASKIAAEKNFKEVGEAYAVLSDPKKRDLYDQGLDLEEIEQGGGGGGFHGGGMPGGMDPNDIFRMFFGGGGGGMGGGMPRGFGGGGGGHSFHFG